MSLSPILAATLAVLPIVVAGVTTLLAWLGVGYSLLALWSARDFLRSLRRAPSRFAPDVTILKPLKGADHDMLAAFASHCRQQYAGTYEILFGVSSLADPAVAVIRELERQFPEQAIRVVECPEVLGPNGKLSNLAQMLPHARYAYLLVNDSDIVVSPQYLATVMGTFSPGPAPGRVGSAHAPRPVGLVTVPYRGLAHRERGKHATVWARMEALGISTDFIPGVFTARYLEKGIHFGLGSTLAVSREALAAIGGFEALVGTLADDYELGARIAKAGYAVELAPEVVETGVPAYDFAGFLRHQLRWSRSTRDSRRWGYAGLVFTFGLPWAALNVIAAGASLESIALFVLALVVRVALALAVGVGILRDGQVLRDLWLLLPRDLCALALWAWSYASDIVYWRGERFLLRRGQLTRV